MVTMKLLIINFKRHCTVTIYYTDKLKWPLCTVRQQPFNGNFANRSINNWMKNEGKRLVARGRE